MGRAYEVRAAAMAKTAAKKSKAYAKHSILIFKEAKSGGTDPDSNLNLKSAIEKAKKAQVPADIIKKAIDKAKGGQADDYSEVIYEAFGPNNSLFIVECLTDNVNRTFHEIRTLITKPGCKLGVPGSVKHMFTSSAIFSFEGYTDEEVLEILLMADCDVTDIELDDGLVTVYAPSSEYAKIRDTLIETNPELEFLEDLVGWVPQMRVTLEGEDLNLVKKMLETLENSDDVQGVFHNLDSLE